METDSQDQSGKPSAPRIVSGLDAATLTRFYPADAEKRRVEGFVTVAVTLDQEGHPTDTQILSETPPDMGFGAAASSLSHTLTYSNPTNAPVVFKFAVKFALDDTRTSGGSPAQGDAPLTPPPRSVQSPE